MEDVHLALVPPGDRLELEDALELALEGAVVIKGLAVDNLHGAKGTGGAAGQPDFTVGTASNAANQFVVRHARRRARNHGPHKVRAAGRRSAVWNRSVAHLKSLVGWRSWCAIRRRSWRPV